MIFHLSSTLIYDSFRIIEYLKKTEVRIEDNIYCLSGLSSYDLKDIFNMLIKMNYINLVDDIYVPSDSTMENHIDKYESTHQIREYIKRYIIYFQPAWSSRIIFGRKEVFYFLNYEEKRCFLSANLYSETNLQTVQWWDDIANLLRQKNNIIKLETGRRGEFLTIDYEKKRTGKTPKMMFLESNLVGYDITSVVNDQDNTPLFIEVKTSNDDPKNAKIHISGNEWDVAKNKKNYLFYVWLLQKNEKLLIFDVSKIEKNIPTNNGSGSWKDVEINLKQFMDNEE